MDERKKIVLGSKDFIGRGLNDLFLNLDLKRTFNELRKDKYENNFDLSEQFKKERDNSRDFIIYGSINSVVNDCDNLLFNVYEDSGFTRFVTSVITSEIGYNQENIYNKKRGKYIISLNNYSGNSIYIFLSGNSLTYADQSFSQKLVFFDSDNNFVSYGTETIEINNDGTTFEINNNFPFLYNKHWIKKEINIIQEPQAIISFSTDSSIINEGDNVNVIVSLDKPSPFGNERADIVEFNNGQLFGDYVLNISGSNINLPYTLMFSENEQQKILNFSFPDDNVVSFDKDRTFQLNNFTLVQTGTNIFHNIHVINTTEKKYVKFNFGQIYQNRLYFTGRKFVNEIDAFPSYTILRNGVHFSKSNSELYPNDNFKLKIINTGGNTLLPPNDALNIGPNFVNFLSGETKEFIVTSKYDGANLHTLKMKFNNNPSSGNYGFLYINGIRLVPISYQDIYGILSYTYVKNALSTEANLIPELNGFSSDYELFFNDINKEITVKSKNSGTYIDLKIEEVTVNSPSFTIQVEEIVAFGNYNQLPIEINLLANSDNNTQTKYDFIIEKIGYKPVNVLGTTVNTIPGVVETVHLVSGLNNILRNWYDTNDEPFYNSATTENISYVSNTNSLLQNYFKMPIGTVFINGFIFLSDAIPTLEPTYVKNNQTLYGAVFNSTVIKSVFFNDPLSCEPETFNELNTVNVKQKTRLTIPALTTAQVNLNRGFTFQFGSNPPLVLYRQATGNNAEKNALHWWNSNVKASGISYNIPLSQWLDYGNITYGQPVGFVDGFSPGLTSVFLNTNTEITLSSKIAGTPFNITNLNHGSVTLPISKRIKVEEIYPNGIVGMTTNKANNKMGGFNVDLIF